MECGTIGCDQLIKEVGEDGEYRQVASARDGEVINVGMALLCSKCVAEHDAHALASYQTRDQNSRE